MTALEMLIERLEKATGPGRILDQEIAVETRWAQNGGGLSNYFAPHFTSSLDAALTLVPEGSYGFAFPWFYSEYSRYEKPCVFWRAAIHKPIWEKATPTLAGDDWFERHQCDHDAPTPAIALCIASLRARSVTSQEQAGDASSSPLTGTKRIEP